MKTHHTRRDLRPCTECGTVRMTEYDGPRRNCARAIRREREARTPPALVVDDVAPDWTGAACLHHEPEMWFPRRKGVVGGGSTRPDWEKPRAVCADCPLLDACREWALSTPDPTSNYGMFGGLTPAERAEARTARTDLQESA